MPDPVPIPKAPDEPDETTSSVIRLNLGGKRYDIRVNVEAREITAGPAEIIQMPAPPVDHEDEPDDDDD